MKKSLPQLERKEESLFKIEITPELPTFEDVQQNYREFTAREEDTEETDEPEVSAEMLTLVLVDEQMDEEEKENCRECHEGNDIPIMHAYHEKGEDYVDDDDYQSCMSCHKAKGRNPKNCRGCHK